MADTFSYESDIAPLRGNNFGGAASPAYFEQQKFLRENMDANREASAVRIAEIQQAAERQQLAFETQRLQIEQTKKEIKDKLEAEAMYPEIMGKLTAVLEDPTKDTPTKVLEIEKTRAGYGKQVIDNPSINNIFNSMSSSLTVKDQKEALKNEVAGRLMGAGQPEAVKSWYGGNVESGTAKEFYDAAKILQQEQQKEKEQELGVLQQKAQSEQQKERQALDVKILDDYEGALRSMVPKGTSEDDFIGMLQSGKTPDKKGTIPAQPQFNSLQVQEMREMMLDLNPSLKPQDVESVPPEQLYSYAHRRLKQKRRGYLSAPTKSTQSLFNE